MVVWITTLLFVRNTSIDVCYVDVIVCPNQHHPLTYQHSIITYRNNYKTEKSDVHTKSNVGSAINKCSLACFNLMLFNERHMAL